MKSAEIVGEPTTPDADATDDEEDGDEAPER
jgi:hypothetical protein